MAFLFTIEEKNVFPNPETLLISPFKEIWERDKTPGKRVALEEFSYIEFMTSVKKSNPYVGYRETEKHDKVFKAVITNAKWKADRKVKAAMDKLRTFQKEASISYNYFMAAKMAAEKMQTFFLTFNINERNEKTLNPIYKPADITKALSDTEKTLANLSSLQKKVDEDIYEKTKTRSDKAVSIFADPSSLNH